MDLKAYLGCADYAAGSKQELDRVADDIKKVVVTARQLERDTATDAVLEQLLGHCRETATIASGHRGVAVVMCELAEQLGALALAKGASEEEVLAILHGHGASSDTASAPQAQSVSP